MCKYDLLFSDVLSSAWRSPVDDANGIINLLELSQLRQLVTAGDALNRNPSSTSLQMQQSVNMQTVTPANISVTTPNLSQKCFSSPGEDISFQIQHQPLDVLTPQILTSQSIVAETQPLYVASYPNTVAEQQTLLDAAENFEYFQTNQEIPEFELSEEEHDNKGKKDTYLCSIIFLSKQ